MRAHLFSHRHDRGAHDSGGAGPALCMLAAGVLLWNSWRCVSGVHRLRLQGKSAGQPESLETWEGEGGRPDPEPKGSPGPPLGPG